MFGTTAQAGKAQETVAHIPATGEGVELTNDELRQRGTGTGELVDERRGVLGEDASQIGLGGPARQVGRARGTWRHGPRGDAGLTSAASTDQVSAS
jgi:hypothetical protein